MDLKGVLLIFNPQWSNLWIFLQLSHYIHQLTSLPHLLPNKVIFCLLSGTLCWIQFSHHHYLTHITIICDFAKPFRNKQNQTTPKTKTKKQTKTNQTNNNNQINKQTKQLQKTQNTNFLKCSFNSFLTNFYLMNTFVISDATKLETMRQWQWGFYHHNSERRLKQQDLTSCLCICGITGK